MVSSIKNGSIDPRAGRDDYKEKSVLLITDRQHQTMIE